MSKTSFLPSYVNRGVRPWHAAPSDWYNHDAIKTVVAIRGTFILETRSAQYEVRASSTVVVPSLLTHRFGAREGPVRMMVMSFPSLNAHWRAALLPANQPRVIGLNAQDMAALDDLHRRCAEEKLRSGTLARQALAGLAQAWLTVLMRAGPRPRVLPRRGLQLQKARERIIARFHEPLRVRDLAREVGMSEAHFRERYRQWLGHSPKEEIIQLRIRKAQDLLFETDDKLADIAASCGFCNEQEFSRHFRKHVGMPPGRWRAQV